MVNFSEGSFDFSERALFKGRIFLSNFGGVSGGNIFDLGNFTRGRGDCFFSGSFDSLKECIMGRKYSIGFSFVFLGGGFRIMKLFF